MAMNGLQMMLKSFGIDFDPEQVKAQVIAFQAELAATLKNFDERLTAIEKAIHESNKNQLVMLEAMNALMNSVNSETRPAGEGAVTSLILENQKDGTGRSN